jgi:hypothetical protein
VNSRKIRREIPKRNTDIAHRRRGETALRLETAALAKADGFDDYLIGSVTSRL